MTGDAPHFARCLLAAQAELHRRRPIDDTLCFVEAFEHCRLGLKGIEGSCLGDVGAEQAMDLIRRTIDTSAIAMWDERGPAFARVVALTRPEKRAFEAAVDGMLLYLESTAGQAWTAGYTSVGGARGGVRGAA